MTPIVEEIEITKLTPYANNSRTHSDKQIKQIAASVKQFGFTIPILIDENNMILAGHGRILAAKEISLDKVPSIRASHLTDAQKRAYIIADNKLTENGGWNQDLLKEEFQFLNDIDLEFDLDITGFEIAEIDLMLDHGLIDEQDDELPETDHKTPPITQLGDIWQLGGHKLFCGDSLKEESYLKLMRDEKASMVFTDPPYNVSIDGHVCGNGSVKHEEFAMASGEMNAAEFTQFLETVSSRMVESSVDGSIHYICMDWRHIQELKQAGEAAGYDLKNICVWVKDNGGMGSLYRSRHEFVFVFKSGEASHTNNVQLGKYGRNRTNVWEYPGVNSFNGQMKDLRLHPTVKPTQMVSDAIMDCSEINDIILDPFGGSGTTLIAAEKTQRKACLIEIDPHYCDVIIKRWQTLTGNSAINTATKEKFNDMEHNND